MSLLDCVLKKEDLGARKVFINMISLSEVGVQNKLS